MNKFLKVFAIAITMFLFTKTSFAQGYIGGYYQDDSLITPREEAPRPSIIVPTRQEIHRLWYLPKRDWDPPEPQYVHPPFENIQPHDHNELRDRGQDLLHK